MIVNFRRRALLPWLAALGMPGHAAGEGETLRIALAPFLSPTALLAAYRPLHEHLERALGRPVEMVTAKDFVALALAARRREHDVVQLPAHLARLAMLDWDYAMLAAPTEKVTVIVGAKADGPVHGSADLRGRSIGMLDPLSLTATIGRRWLQQQGLADAVTVIALPSVNSALYALDRGEIAAFVAADTQLTALPATTPRGEHVLASIGDIPGPLFIARPHLPAADLAAIRSALTTFEPDPKLPETAANSAFRPLGEARLAALDAYVEIARQALAAVR